MWSAAVLEPALPGRSRAATGSPVPAGPWSTNATSGWWPKVFFQVAVASCLSECAMTSTPSMSTITWPSASGASRAGQRPDTCADFGPRRADRGERLRAGGGEGVDQAGDGRVGGHRAEHGRLGPQHGDIRQAVPAQRDRQRDIQQDLARIVHRPRLAPRRQRRRYRRVQAGLADRLDQQHRPGLRDHPAAAALDTDTRIRPDTLASPGEVPPTVAGTRASTILLLQVRGTFCFSDHPSDNPLRESPRLTMADGYRHCR